MSTRGPLVSICVGVRNGMATAERFVQAVRAQTYGALELVVVDNFSTDGTAEHYRRHADLFLQQGPERSAQRNLAIARASGVVVIVLDADQYLSPGVVEECVALLTPDVHGIFIPEDTAAEGFWGACKKFERDFYLAGDLSAEAARCFWRHEVLSLGGYDERQTGSEDWDLSDRMLARFGHFARTRARILHDEGRIDLVGLLRKKRYYAERGIADYLRVAPAYRRLPFSAPPERAPPVVAFSAPSDPGLGRADDEGARGSGVDEPPTGEQHVSDPHRRPSLVSVVVPVYAEAKNLPVLVGELQRVAVDRYRWEYIFVNDGSPDDSLDVLKGLAAADSRIQTVDLSRNFGKEAALSAGLAHAAGDAVICLDADLQHPALPHPDAAGPLGARRRGGRDRPRRDAPALDGAPRRIQVVLLADRTDVRGRGRRRFHRLPAARSTRGRRLPATG